MKSGCVFQKIRDCAINTTLSLSPDKQGLFCDGGRKSSCGQRNAPEIRQSTPTWFLKYVSLDLDGPDRSYCSSWSGSATGDDHNKRDGSDDSGRRRPLTLQVSSPSTADRVPGRVNDRPPVNAYTFVGSYYHVYIKMADCARPTGQVSIKRITKNNSLNEG